MSCGTGSPGRLWVGSGAHLGAPAAARELLYVTGCGPTVRTSPRRRWYTTRSTARRPRVSKPLVGRVGPNPRPADYENYGPALPTLYLHGYHGAVPPMALIALCTDGSVHEPVHDHHSERLTSTTERHHTSREIRRYARPRGSWPIPAQSVRIWVFCAPGSRPPTDDHMLACSVLTAYGFPRDT
jgi:hypothetical protein